MSEYRIIQTRFNCPVVLMLGDDGKYAAFSTNMRGIGAIKASENEAIESVKEQLRLCIIDCHKRGAEIPWKEEKWYQGSGHRRQVMVNI